MHNFHSDPDGSEGNDIFVRMLNRPTTNGKGWDKAFSNQVGVWMWDTLFHHHGEDPEYGLIQWDLAAGAHTLQISGRSHEMAIDRIHLHSWNPLSKSVCAPLSQRQGYPAPAAPECNILDHNDGPAGEDGYVRAPDWDFTGNDIWPSVQYNVATVDACLAHCDVTQGCIGITWHSWGGCFPKQGIGARKPQPGAIGAYLEAYRPSPQNPNAPTEPASPTEPSPTPPPPPPTAPAVVEYSYEEDFGRGCCRSTDGVRENEIYIHHLEVKDFATCVDLCSGEPTCNGFELTGHEGCELHTSPITHISENAQCQCLIRHAIVPAPTAPAPTEPSPTGPSPTPPPPTPSPNPEPEVVAVLVGEFGFLPTYSGAREGITAETSISIFLSPDGVRTAEAHITGTGFPANSDGSPTLLPAHLHAEPCAMSGGAHYQDPSCSPHCHVNHVNEVWPPVSVSPNGDGSGQASTAWAPLQTDFGHISVVIHDTAGTKMLCADLTVTGTVGEGSGDDGGSGDDDVDDNSGPSCQIQPGFDLWGHDVPGGMNTGAVDVGECAGQCLDHPECTHFTFIWNGCYLKSSAAGKKANKNGVSGWCTDQVDDFLNDAHGPNGEPCMNGVIVDTIPFDNAFTCDCSETIYIGDNCEELAATDHNCALETNVDLFGNDIPGHGHIPVGSGEECASLCASFDQCIAFTMVWGHCYMKSSAEGRVSVGFPATSGTCRDAVETTSAPVGQTKVCDQSLPGINLHGNDIPGGAHKVTADEFGCAALCEANPSCGFFTYIWDHCYLKSSGAGSETQSQGKSGACITVTDGGEPTDPPTNPPVVTDPPTAPPSNPSPGGGGASTFTYNEDFGTGYCRTTGSIREDEIYIHHLEVTDFATCADLCSAVGECNGFELTEHEGCELHTSPITHIKTSQQGQCFIKHTTDDN